MIATIFLVGFLIIVAVAFWQNAKEARNRRRLIEHGARAVGHVVFHSQKTKSGKGRLHFAKIKFETPDGQEFRHTVEHGTPEPRPPLGTKVQIAYDPANPDESVVVEWNSRGEVPLAPAARSEAPWSPSSHATTQSGRGQGTAGNAPRKAPSLADSYGSRDPRERVASLEPTLVQK